MTQARKVHNIDITIASNTNKPNALPKRELFSLTADHVASDLLLGQRSSVAARSPFANRLTVCLEALACCDVAA